MSPCLLVADILVSLDAGKVTAPTLHDLSAAFDTIDHTILLRRLDDWFGITGKALNWFISYQTERCQRIKLGECLSSKDDLNLESLNLQGSVLRIEGRYHSLSLCWQQPAVYFLCSRGSVVALNGLQSCLASIRSWMSMNKLKLDPDKTEFLPIGNKRQWSNFLSMFPIELLGVETNPAKSVWNLGVSFDQTFTFCSHVSAVCSSCFCHIRGQQRIRLHLDQSINQTNF